jgi:hypothetical protein
VFLSYLLVNPDRSSRAPGRRDENDDTVSAVTRTDPAYRIEIKRSRAKN